MLFYRAKQVRRKARATYAPVAPADAQGAGAGRAERMRAAVGVLAGGEAAGVQVLQDAVAREDLGGGHGAGKGEEEGKIHFIRVAFRES